MRFEGLNKAECVGVGVRGDSFPLGSGIIRGFLGCVLREGTSLHLHRSSKFPNSYHEVFLACLRVPITRGSPARDTLLEYGLVGLQRRFPPDDIFRLKFST